MPNISKINLPNTINSRAIRKAVVAAFLLIRRLVSGSLCPTKDRKMGTFATGLVMANIPVNTLTAKVQRSIITEIALES